MRTCPRFREQLPLTDNMHYREVVDELIRVFHLLLQYIHPTLFRLKQILASNQPILQVSAKL